MSMTFEDEAGLLESVEDKSRKGRGPGRIVGFLLVGSAIGALVLTYNYFRDDAPQAPGNEEFRTPLDTPNLQFRAPAAKPETNQFVLAPPETPPAPEPAAAVTAPPPVIVDDSAARAAAEAERLRLEAEARKLARLQSNMLVLSDAVAERGGNEGDGPGGGMQGPTDEETDPNRRFFKATAAQDVARVEATVNPRIDALIPQGTLIRGVLETAIQSDLPGMVRAVISTDVWSFDGRRILLPKGTMLTGEYRSGIARGQTRVLIVWQRALRSDGTTVSLGSYGTDDLGRSGLAGKVDKHYLERFGASAVLSLIGGVSSFVAGLNADGSSNSGSGNTGNSNNDGSTQAQATISQTMADMANQALAGSINIPPTVHVNQGTQIIVFMARDLDFSALYPDPVKEALRELRRRK